MKRILVPLVVFLMFSGAATAGQMIAGAPDDHAFQRIMSAPNVDAKLQEIAGFEQQFPQSKGLPDAYQLAIELCRQKGDRAKVVEYGEKLLKLDPNSITAMMVLSRNYAMERKNVDRAVTLAQQAIDRIAVMKAGPMPSQYTEAQWNDYLQGSEKSARSILDYAKSMKVAAPEVQ